ncbi:MAG TPA: glycosyltransferase family 4 protein [Tepidisphaeraceae bacterium]|nr:glycosyltransferase family 4 protein [Tepidisphaeraceae bacterium]
MNNSSPLIQSAPSSDTNADRGRVGSAPRLTNAPSTTEPLRVAFVVNEMTPYRAHKLRRFADEIEGMQAFTLLTHAVGTAAFKTHIPPQLHLTVTGVGLGVGDQTKLAFVRAHWRNGGRVIQWLRENPVHAVVIFGYGDVGHIRVIRWCHAHGLPCLMWGDSNILGDRVRGLRAVVKHLLVRRIVRWCDALLVCGRLGKAYFAKYGARPEELFLVPNEPDYDEIFSLPEPLIQDAAMRLGLPSGRRRLIFSGRLIDWKRVDLLIDAFAQIADRRPEWDLIIVGGGPCATALQTRVPAALRARVKFTGFVETSAQVAAIYRVSDGLVLPSDSEPWALVLNEAAASGLAIVASSVVGAAPELIREGVNGYVFRRGKLDDLVRCLLLVTDAASVDRLKAESRPILDEWRKKADPVDGLRSAFRFLNLA